MGPTKSNIEYNLDAGLETYTNSSIHTHLSSYTETSRLVHGPDYDPRSEEHLDPELVMWIGQGKKHGRFYIGDDILDEVCSRSCNNLGSSKVGRSQHNCLHHHDHLHHLVENPPRRV
jgi:hypothetical protein